MTAIRVNICQNDIGFITVEAKDDKEAVKIVSEMYENGDFLFNDEGVNDFHGEIKFEAGDEVEIY